jgi:hypothetical protein
MKGKVVRQISVQRANAVLEDFFLVVYRDGNLDQTFARRRGLLAVAGQQQRTRRAFPARITRHARLPHGTTLLMPSG